MSLLIVQLGHLCFRNPRLNFDVLSYASAAFSIPNSTALYRPEDLLEALRTHSVWPCRGIGLQLKFEFLVDGEALDRNHFSEIIDTLGRELETAEACMDVSMIRPRLIKCSAISTIEP